MFGDYTSALGDDLTDLDWALGDGSTNLDWALGDGSTNLDWALGDDAITLDGGLGDDALKLDDGSFQLAATFGGDNNNNCKIRFPSGNCPKPEREFLFWTCMAELFQPDSSQLAESETAPEQKTPPKPGPELVPIPQNPDFNCAIRAKPGCNLDGGFLRLSFLCTVHTYPFGGVNLLGS